MKIEKIIIVLILILTFSCQKGKKTIETNADSEIELKNEKSDTISDFDTNLNSENQIFRNITELNKYKGFTEIMGMVLGRTDKALAYIQKDSIQILLLEQIIQDNSPKVKYKILDEVEIIADKTKLFSNPADCELIDNPDEKFIFGITNNQEKEYFNQDHILKVWKVDLRDNKFKEINKEKVKCFNQWYGYDE